MHQATSPLTIRNPPQVPRRRTRVDGNTVRKMVRSLEAAVTNGPRTRGEEEMGRRMFSRTGSSLVLVLGLVAASGDDSIHASAANRGGSTPAALSNATQSELKVAYVTPDPIGQNQFLNLGQDGVDRVAEEYGVETETVESTNPSEREENVRAVARDGWDVVVVLGFEFLDIITQAADEFPDTYFVTVDFCLEEPKPNVHCAVFREHEAAFLIGAVAGLLTESNVIGTVTAIDTPFTRRWPEGFEQGALEVNPDVDVKSLFVGSFTDPAKAKEQALAMSAD